MIISIKLTDQILFFMHNPNTRDQFSGFNLPALILIVPLFVPLSSRREWAMAHNPGDEQQTGQTELILI